MLIGRSDYGGSQLLTPLETGNDSVLLIVVLESGLG